MEGEYHSVTPHAGEGIPQPQDGIVVTSYLQIREALQEMVNAGATEVVLYATQINTEMVEQYMQTAVTHLHKNTAIGAYALDDITYESGNSGGIPSVSERNSGAINPTKSPSGQPQIKPHSSTGRCIGHSIEPISGICPVRNGIT
jgi:hypothetical protein